MDPQRVLDLPADWNQLQRTTSDLSVGGGGVTVGVVAGGLRGVNDTRSVLCDMTSLPQSMFWCRGEIIPSPTTVDPAAAAGTGSQFKIIYTFVCSSVAVVAFSLIFIVSLVFFRVDVIISHFQGCLFSFIQFLFLVFILVLSLFSYFVSFSCLLNICTCVL